MGRVSVVDKRNHRCRKCGAPASIELDDNGPEFPSYYCGGCVRDLGIEYDPIEVLRREMRGGMSRLSRGPGQCTGERMCYCAPFEAQSGD